LRYSFSSSTNGSAVRSPIAASITGLPFSYQPPSRLEAAYHRADKAIRHVIDLLAA
jgi:hypothetical protein